MLAILRCTAHVHIGAPLGTQPSWAHIKALVVCLQVEDREGFL